MKWTSQGLAGFGDALNIATSTHTVLTRVGVEELAFWVGAITEEARRANLATAPNGGDSVATVALASWLCTRLKNDNIDLQVKTEDHVFLLAVYIKNETSKDRMTSLDGRSTS